MRREGAGQGVTTTAARTQCGAEEEELAGWADLLVGRGTGVQGTTTLAPEESEPAETHGPAGRKRLPSRG